jgi:hypothetical protein
MALVSVIPATGSEISMGRIAGAMGLATTNVGLNSTLGVNRSKLSGSVAQNVNIAASGTTAESSDFGGMSSSFTY